MSVSNLFQQLSRPAGETFFGIGDEARVLWDASRLVQAVSSLKELRIDEQGLDDGNWTLTGCLEATDDRELSGKLERLDLVGADLSRTTY